MSRTLMVILVILVTLYKKITVKVFLSLQVVLDSLHIFLLHLVLLGDLLARMIFLWLKCMEEKAILIDVGGSGGEQQSTFISSKGQEKALLDV
jgi:hypothetical protein